LWVGMMGWRVVVCMCTARKVHLSDRVTVQGCVSGFSAECWALIGWLCWLLLMEGAARIFSAGQGALAPFTARAEQTSRIRGRKYLSQRGTALAVSTHEMNERNTTRLR
jgi:hypothetical protein